jgi:nucleotide-binding universal stress UspA family protein
MKILLAADGSEYTKRAAKHLASHLGWFARRPDLHVLHVRPPLPYPGAAARVSASTIRDYERDEARTALKVAAKVLDRAGVQYTAAFDVGDVSTEIDNYVRDHDIELVVLGSHGHGALAGLALGSVAAKVIATSKVPVMVVR